MADKRIKDLGTTITAFRTGDVIPVDGPDGTAKMRKDDLLRVTAENALENNIAPAFDPDHGGPNNDGNYPVGYSVIYQGKQYTFNVDHSGAWSSADADEVDSKQSVLRSDDLSYAVKRKETIKLKTASTLTYVFLGKLTNKVKLTVHNGNVSVAWVNVGIYDENKASIFAKSLNMAANTSEVVEFTFSSIATYIGYENINSRTGITIDVESEGYASVAYDVSKKLEREVDGKIYTVGKIGSYDIPYTIGTIEATLVNASGSAKYAELKFYDSNGGTQIATTGNQLVAANSTFVKKVYLKTAATYVNYSTPNAASGLYANVDALSYEDKFSLSSNNVAGIGSCSVANDNATRSQTGNDVDISFSTSTLNRNGGVQVTCPFNISVGDFVFAAMNVEVEEDCFIQFTFYTQNTEQSVYHIGIKAGKSYPIYIASKDVENATYMHLNIILPGYSNTSATNVIHIKNCSFCKNDFLVSEKTSDNFKARHFTKEQRSFVVSASGDGDFVTINQGVSFARLRLKNITSEPSVLYIRNGNYNMECSNKRTMNYPYAAINKGSNMLSLIGESREGVVVSYTSNNTVRLKVLDIGDSECVIANMTINSLQDETYTDPSGDGHQNCYCIHSDMGTLIDHAHNTEFRNLRLLSHCHSPLGAGIQRNQHIVIDDCIFISDSKVGNSYGACYIHGLGSGDGNYDSTMSLEIRNCDFRSYDGTNSITLPAVGSSTFANIKTTINDMRVYSNGTPVNSSVMSADLQPECSGNNVSALNLAEY